MNKPFLFVASCLLVCLYIFIMSSCKPQTRSRNNGDLHLTSIEVNTTRSVTDSFDSSYKFIKFIELETTKASIISEINKLIVADDSTIIVFDKKQQSIFFFDFTGKFVNVINKLGGGPEEYRNIKDITYNSQEKCLVVLDQGTQSLIKYELLNGKFISRKKIQHQDNYGYTVDYISGHYLFNRLNFTPPEFPGQIAIAQSSDLTISGSGLPQSTALANMPITFEHSLDTHDSIAYSLDFINDTIYSVANNKIVPTYYLKYPIKDGNKIARELMDGQNNYGENYIEKLFSDGGIWNFSNLFFADNFIRFSFSYKNQAFVNIFNTQTHKTVSVSAAPVLDAKYYINTPISSFKSYLISQAIPKMGKKSFDKNPLLCIYKIAPAQ